MSNKRFILWRKRALSLAVTLAVLCGALFTQGGLIASAATTIYTAQNHVGKATNPSGQFSMEYFDTVDYQFKKMTQFITTATPNYWAVTDASGALIKTYCVQSTSSEYAVVRFSAPNAGVATLTNSRTDSIAGHYVSGYSAGEIIIVQKSGEGYAPIWPSTDAYNWNAIPQKTSSGDTTTTMVWPSNLQTYLNQGDEILFITRPTVAGKKFSTNVSYRVKLEETDDDSLRPTVWDSYFKGADDKLVTSAPVFGNFSVRQNTNTETSSYPYTKEYINSTAGFQKMENCNSASRYWSMSADANVKIGPYYMTATANNYSAIVYHAQNNGYANLKNGYEIYSSSHSSYDEAEVMVVQSSENGYYPVWPSKGEWSWYTVPKGDNNSNKTGIVMDTTVYMNQGDGLALVIRSSNSSKGITWLGSDCHMYFTAVGSDYRGLYPDKWSESFEGFEYRLPTAGWVKYYGSPYIRKENSGLFTCEYNVGDGFVLMEKQITTADPYYWQSNNGKAIVKPYMQKATATTYSALAFHTTGSGYLKISNKYSLYTHYSSSGAYAPAQVMLVQGSDTGGYAPIWPNKGEWEWQTLPVRTSSDDTVGLDMGEIKTYVNAGEKVYFVVRSSATGTGSTAMQSDLSVNYLASAEDDAGLYPTVWSESFSGYEAPVIEMEEQLATLSVSEGDGEIRQILPLHPVFLDNDRANPTFKNIPVGLEGKSFICTYCWDTNQEVGWTRTATAESDGWIYAIAANRNCASLIADGFTSIPVEINDLFYRANTGTSDNCALYKKYVNAGDSVTIYDRWTLLIFATLENTDDYTVSDAFLPPVIVMSTSENAANYAKADRKWQGCSNIVQTSDNVLYAGWCTGGPHEVAAGNYEAVMRSDDGGETWREFMYVASNPAAENGWVLETAFFLAPNGSLYLFANASISGNGNFGFWVMHTDNPNAENPTWSEPQRLGHGVFNSIVTVLENGSWIFGIQAAYYDVDYNDIWASDDEGASWYLKSRVHITDASPDETCIVELNDGRLWYTCRSTNDNGIKQSYSYDGGNTWTEGEDAAITGPGSKFMIKRLASGNLLMVNHYEFIGRDHMTASLSTDDGETWQYHLLLDERKTSYPYVTTWDYNGTEVITTVYDHERYDAKQIYIARFTEEDIINGSFSSDYAREKVLIDSLSGDALFDYNNSWFVQQNTNPYPWGYCTYGYFDGNEFKKMETYVEGDDSTAAHWQSQSGRSNVTNWRVFATSDESPLISFSVGKCGYLEISEDAANPLQTNGGPGRFMIVQVNGKGEYSPLYPAKGEWQWQELSTTPADIGTIRTYMASDDKVYVIWQTDDTNGLLVETMTHFKFTYSSTDTEGITPTVWTRWLGGGALETNQTEADEITAQFNSLSAVTLSDRNKVKSIRSAYNKLTDVQKALVSDIELLVAAEQKITNLLNGIDTVAYVEAMYSALPNTVNSESLCAYKEITAAVKMLTAEELNRLTHKDELDIAKQSLDNYITINNKVNEVENLISIIPVPYDFTSRISLEKAYGAFLELSDNEKEMVSNRALLAAVRRIASLRDADQNLPNYLTNKIIAVLPDVEAITLENEYEIEYALAFYSVLTEAQQGSVTNYDKLSATALKLDELKAEAAPTTYNITAESGANGTVTATGNYTEGSSVVYQFVPFVGGELLDVIVDGVSVGAVNSYTFENISENHTVTAVFNGVEVICGDINGDGVIDIRDLVRLKKHLADMTDDIDTDNADIDGDGKVTAIDLCELRKKMFE